MSDAREVFDAITPGVTRFMRWQAPASFGEYVSDRAKRVQEADGTAVSFVIRSADTGEFLGIAGIEDIGAEFPELGIWLKEAAQGRGYGGEAIRAVASWASRTFGKTGFTWPRRGCERGEQEDRRAHGRDRRRARVEPEIRFGDLPRPCKALVRTRCGGPTLPVRIKPSRSGIDGRIGFFVPAIPASEDETDMGDIMSRHGIAAEAGRTPHGFRVCLHRPGSRPAVLPLLVGER